MSRWSVVLVALLTISPSAHAHVGDRLFMFFELTDEDLAQIDLHDGSAEDWREVIGEPSLRAVDFFINPLAGDAPDYDPADLDFQIWLGWHQATGRIYVAMESVDNVYINEYKENLGSQADNWSLPNSSDSMVFMLDGDHSGGEYDLAFDDFENREDWRQAHHAQAQAYGAIARTSGSRYVDLLPFLGWFSLPPYAEGGGGVVGEAPTISVIEFYLTAFDNLIKESQTEAVVSTLLPGKVIGFSIHIGDFDRPKVVHAGYLLPPLGRSIVTADLFADGLLVGKGQAPEISVVESDSWGRIKASFGK